MDSGDEEGMFECLLVRVSGRVQGVGYRQACVSQALALGINGWVRNRRDGSVEAMLQGSSQQLADMCNWLRHGMTAARVDMFEMTQVPPPIPRFDGFDCLPTV